ncbi:hypothetical protein [Microbulbifer halophilus]|uniref:Uncharacterized protein n=1 Tax=Microbulbifer halophilus TaxID=453963 RepID=A0ABW5E916_9GAMM|nr:hypothetical protein [Microbulbifer halophilus]MCW8126729.1 hypothetical protein [Microbulbifer halophilus]
MDKYNGPAIDSRGLDERTDNSRSVFQLQPGLPVDVLQEAICHRLEMLSAVIEVMSKAEFTSADVWQLQRYGWAMSEMIDDLKEIFYSAWEKSQSNRRV